MDENMVLLINFIGSILGNTVSLLQSRSIFNGVTYFDILIAMAIVRIGLATYRFYFYDDTGESGSSSSGSSSGTSPYSSSKGNFKRNTHTKDTDTKWYAGKRK